MLLQKVRSVFDYKGIEKCVLAFSGGLDTTVIASLLSDMGIKPITVTLDMGTATRKSIQEVERKAKLVGARHYTIDAREEFLNEYIIPAIMANSLYQGEYPNSTALSRPLIVKHLVDVARLENAQAVAHGSTGKGNDQVRIDNGIRALAPELRIIAPVRDWGLWRDEEIEYARKKGLPVKAKKSIYSTDENMWGRSIECGPIENPELEVPEDAYEWTVKPEKAPNKPEYVDILFDAGKPVECRIGGAAYRGIRLVEKLNELAGAHGVGRIEHMEDRVIGFKSREAYEAPAATVLLKAHKDLEKTILSKDELEVKEYMDNVWTNLVYSGKWYTPLRKQVEAFIKETQKHITGRVRIKLFKGNADVVARESKYALYDKKTATYDKETTWNQKEGGIFTKIYGLEGVMAYRLRGE
ncbi:MAG: argininosuccinate synthase [Candidatus Micrarchaeia archaeon]